MTAPNRKREVQVNFRVSPGGAGADRAENVPAGDSQPRSLSAEDGAGRLCGEAGIAGAEGAGVFLRRSSNN